ncbi:hypothetical protein HS088_TW04G00963 [Tripterygium wilfordii]|uniref:Uncharacterized protein n=2 Tax=Tripterygium wilfordii TaxID=458696 RepID=A0A7J7DRH5_TRIWF|nr:hypothetical protein HS088_TW04G00963 [Tripterygium wilfordii]
MIVKGLRPTQDRVSEHDLIKKLEEDLSYSPKTVIDSCEFGEYKGVKMWTEAEADMESGGLSEEVESPKSVAMRGRRGKVHSQVLKIREEELHLGEDIGEGLYGKDGIGAVIRDCIDYNHHYNRSVRRPALDVVSLSRPILPSSPLSGKTPVRALH